MQILSFGIEVWQGNSTAVFAFRIIGILGIAFWIVWVSISIFKIQTKLNDLSEISKEVENEQEADRRFLSKQLYFDGTNRNFLDDLRFWNEAKAKENGFKKTEDLVKILWDGESKGLKIERVNKDFRVIMCVGRFENTQMAPTSRYIPADNDPNIVNEFVRFIHFELQARAEGKMQKIEVRLRSEKGNWLKNYGTGRYASYQVEVKSKSWQPFEAVLGPIRADKPCYLSFDLLPPAPTGSYNALFIRDLKIKEMRETG